MHNMKHFGNYLIKYQENWCNRGVKELKCKINTQQNTVDSAIWIFRDSYSLVDIV